MIKQNGNVLVIEKMHVEAAQQIVTWKYDSPYDMYNMSNTDEDIAELLDGSYYGIKNEFGQLTGFVCFGFNAQVKGGRLANLYMDNQATDIGIGLRPDLTGQGNGIGANLLQAAINFGREKLHYSSYRLSVAAFNLRAINVYKSCGFIEKGSFTNETASNRIPFIVMIKV